MPTLSVKRDWLFDAMQQRFSDEQFADLCFDFGLELDEVTTEARLMQRQSGEGTRVGGDVDGDSKDEVIFKIDVPANRYDLLCLEGLVRGLLVFQERVQLPDYRVLPSSAPAHVFTVSNATAQVRPFLVAAVLPDMQFTQSVYDSFIELQDKLHQNIGRRRSIVAIGTHDLDTLQGPFVYDALPPSQIKFRPLSQTREYTAVELMHLYSTDTHLKPYLAIVRDSPVYPVIKDSRGVVLSMPPIINGHHSRITLHTRNVLIECTATDLTKAQVVLETIVCMFSQYCRRPFACQPVEIRTERSAARQDTAPQLYPRLEWRSFTVNVATVANYIGVSASRDLPVDKLASLLTRMSLNCSRVSNDESREDLLVRVPPTRHDILHVCDIIEDAAIAYGYNNIVKMIPQFGSIALQDPLNKLSDQLRQEVAQAGFTEALTFSLCARDDIGAKMRYKCDSLPVVHVSNPKALEFQVVRTALLPGLLKTLASNRKQPLPLQLFEVSDVVHTAREAETGARNWRHLAAVFYGRSSGFEVIHGLLDRLMQLLEVPAVVSAASGCHGNDGYWLRPAEDDSYLAGRCADVLVDGSCVGRLGVLHPEVITNFDLNMPCSALEINIERFV